MLLTSCVVSFTFVVVLHVIVQGENVADRIGQNLWHALLGSNTKGKSTNDETPERRFVAVLDRQSLRDVGGINRTSYQEVRGASHFVRSFIHVCRRLCT